VSMELFVILAAGHAPDSPAWNRALAETGTPAVLAQNIDLSKHTGFLPVTVGGSQTGFYFLLVSFAELAAHYPAVAALKPEKPVVYSLGYGGDLNECAAVFYSASVLVEKFGGTAFEPQGGIVMGAKELLSAAKQCHETVGSEKH
jgi:hypothetical protein